MAHFAIHSKHVFVDDRLPPQESYVLVNAATGKIDRVIPCTRDVDVQLYLPRDCHVIHVGDSLLVPGAVQFQHPQVPIKLSAQRGVASPITVVPQSSLSDNTAIPHQSAVVDVSDSISIERDVRRALSNTYTLGIAYNIDLNSIINWDRIKVVLQCLYDSNRALGRECPLIVCVTPNQTGSQALGQRNHLASSSGVIANTPNAATKQWQNRQPPPIQIPARHLKSFATNVRDGIQIERDVEKPGHRDPPRFQQANQGHPDRTNQGHPDRTSQGHPDRTNQGHPDRTSQGHPQATIQDLPDTKHLQPGSLDHPTPSDLAPNQHRNEPQRSTPSPSPALFAQANDTDAPQFRSLRESRQSSAHQQNTSSSSASLSSIPTATDDGRNGGFPAPPRRRRGTRAQQRGGGNRLWSRVGHRVDVKTWRLDTDDQCNGREPGQTPSPTAARSHSNIRAEIADAMSSIAERNGVDSSNLTSMFQDEVRRNGRPQLSMTAIESMIVQTNQHERRQERLRQQNERVKRQHQEQELGRYQDEQGSSFATNQPAPAQLQRASTGSRVHLGGGVRVAGSAFCSPKLTHFQSRTASSESTLSHIIDRFSNISLKRPHSNDVPNKGLAHRCNSDGDMQRGGNNNNSSSAMSRPGDIATPAENYNSHCFAGAMDNPDENRNLMNVDVGEMTVENPSSPNIATFVNDESTAQLVREHIPFSLDGAFQFEGPTIRGDQVNVLFVDASTSIIGCREGGKPARAPTPLNKVEAVHTYINYTACQPARLLGLGYCKGRIMEGYDADLVVLAPPQERASSEATTPPVQLTVACGMPLYQS